MKKRRNLNDYYTREVNAPIRRKKPARKRIIKPKYLKSPVLYDFKKTLNKFLETEGKAELIITTSDAVKIYNALSSIGIESYFK